MRKRVREEISDPDVFENWFDNLEFRKPENETLTVLLDNPTQAAYFRKRFLPPIKKAARAEYGDDISVQIEGRPEGDTESSLPSDTSSNGDTPNSNGTSTPSPSPDPEPVDTKSKSTGTQKTEQDILESDLQRLNLRPDYRFETFVRGSCNQLAHAATRSVYQQPGKAYNPLFLHGDVGLGKTHLLQALLRAFLEDPESSIQPREMMYLTCETFVRHFINGVHNGGDIESFRNRVRSLKLLVLDDVHFLSGKSGCQREFFHTFNDLYNSGSQIVLSSDRHPSDIPEIKKRLYSRFKWGLTAELNSPCPDTADHILRKKLEKNDVDLQEEARSFIAQNCSDNVRDLENAVSRLTALSHLQEKKKLSLDTIKDVFSPHSEPVREQSVSVNDIRKTTARFFDVKEEKLNSESRKKQVCEARHAAIFLSCQLTNHTREEIGAFFGDKSHSSVHYAVQKVKEKMEKDRRYRSQIEHLESKIQETNHTGGEVSTGN